MTEQQNNYNFNTPTKKTCDTRPAVDSNNTLAQQRWHQWCAGFIDGHGHIVVSKTGQVTVEIITDNDHKPMIRQIQKAYGGTVKPRAGSASVRWRLTKKESVTQLCERINGYLRHNVRRNQFERACAVLDLDVNPSSSLTRDSCYIAGLFDGVGSVTFNVSQTSAARSQLSGNYGKAVRLQYSRKHHELSLIIDNSDQYLLNSIRDALKIGSVITKQSSKNSKRRTKVHYRWAVRNYEQLCAMQAYLRRTRVGYSIKHKRLSQVERYFELIGQKCHLADDHSAMFKRWSQFCHDWFNTHSDSG